MALNQLRRPYFTFSSHKKQAVRKNANSPRKINERKATKIEILVRYAITLLFFSFHNGRFTLLKA